MHNFDYEHYGYPIGGGLMALSALMTWLADHGFSLFGVALGLFGAWIQWKTYRLREADSAARRKAMETKPCPGPTVL